MGIGRHESATTTLVLNVAIRRSQASRSLSWGLGSNPKTVAKWRKLVTVDDLKIGTNAPYSMKPTEAERQWLLHQ
jgi:hypothetical protein